MLPERVAVTGLKLPRGCLLHGAVSAAWLKCESCVCG